MMVSLDELDDDHLLWLIPGEMGLEVAKRWRALNDVIYDLKAEVARLTKERDEYASAALAGLSGLVCTPERGYVKDGGPGLLASDMRRLRDKFDWLRAENARFAREREAITGALIRAAGTDPEPGPAVRYPDDDTLATEGRTDER